MCTEPYGVNVQLTETACLTYSRGIALTANGFRSVERLYDHDHTPYEQRGFPFNRILSLGMKYLVQDGNTPETVKAKLYEHISQTTQDSKIS